MTHVAYRAGLAFYHDLGCQEGLLCFAAVSFSIDLLTPSSGLNSMGKYFGHKRQKARRGQQFVSEQFLAGLIEMIIQDKR
jgi:hypothetical protein